MKTTWTIAAFVLLAFGVIWILQGINLLPGSFMTGRLQWALYGSILVAGGIILLLITHRRRGKH